jgi:hypothetical protein
MYCLAEMDCNPNEKTFTMTNEFFENSKRVVALLKDRPWLFTETPYLTVDRYIKYFEYGKESEFHIFPAMLPFKVEILDEFKGKVYNTMFLPTGPSSLGMHTLIQINHNLHVVFMWGNSNDNRDTVLYATIHALRALDYVKFLTDYDEFVYNDDKPSGGFLQTPQ